jgi:hypothetical protein
MLFQIDILYTADCLNWEATAYLVYDVLTDLGFEGEFSYWQVDSQEQAEEWGFTGSPTVLIDGRDPFASPDLEPTLERRTYFSPEQGMVEHPTYNMLYQVLAPYSNMDA